MSRTETTTVTTTKEFDAKGRVVKETVTQPYWYGYPTITSGGSIKAQPYTATYNITNNTAALS